MSRKADFFDRIHGELQGIRAAGLSKSERLLVTPQGAIVAPWRVVRPSTSAPTIISGSPITRQS